MKKTLIILASILVIALLRLSFLKYLSSVSPNEVEIREQVQTAADEVLEIEIEPPSVYLFEEGLVSTGKVEYGCTFSPEGDEVYFARSEQGWGQGNMVSSIYRSTLNKGVWTEPQLATFSGTHDDSDPHLTADGQTLYFISNRPNGEVKTSADIWMVKKQADGSWSEPNRLPYPVNSEATEYSPRTDGAGNLYFASTRDGGFGQGDLYKSSLVEDTFSTPQNLGNTINSPKGEWNLEINQKGDLLIFEASEREENLSGYGDLYISFKQGSS